MKVRTVSVLATIVVAASLFCGCATLTEEDAAVPAGDHDMTQLVLDRLDQDATIAHSQFAVTSEGGIVTLSGLVRSEMERARVLGVVRGTPGVKGVVDRLRLYR